MSVAPKQFQNGFVPTIALKDLEGMQPEPRWAGIFCKVKLPEGNTKELMGHSIWIHIYSARGDFYQVGFHEGSKSRAEGEPNTTVWHGFYASTQDFVPPLRDNVITHYRFNSDKEVLGIKGETYLLYIKLEEGKVVMSIWDKDGIILGTVSLPESSKTVQGTFRHEGSIFSASVNAAMTLEAYTNEDEKVGDLEPFVLSNFILAGDPYHNANLLPSSFQVQVSFNQPPTSYGVKREDNGSLLIGNGLPRQRWGNI